MENNQLFELDGVEALGSYLQIQPCSDNAPDLSQCSIQWYRVSSEGGKKELISGILFIICLFCLFCWGWGSQTCASRIWSLDAYSAAYTSPLLEADD